MEEVKQGLIRGKWEGEKERKEGGPSEPTVGVGKERENDKTQGNIIIVESNND